VRVLGDAQKREMAQFAGSIQMFTLAAESLSSLAATKLTSRIVRPRSHLITHFLSTENKTES